jgi:hypothetical protein
MTGFMTGANSSTTLQSLLKPASNSTEPVVTRDVQTTSPPRRPHQTNPYVLAPKKAQEEDTAVPAPMQQPPPVHHDANLQVRVTRSPSPPPAAPPAARTRPPSGRAPKPVANPEPVGDHDDDDSSDDDYAPGDQEDDEEEGGDEEQEQEEDEDTDSAQQDTKADSDVDDDAAGDEQVQVLANVNLPEEHILFDSYKLSMEGAKFDPNFQLDEETSKRLYVDSARLYKQFAKKLKDIPNAADDAESKYVPVAYLVNILRLLGVRKVLIGEHASRIAHKCAKKGAQKGWKQAVQCVIDFNAALQKCLVALRTT